MIAPHSKGVQNAVAAAIARAWFDGDFYQRLVSDPADVLRELGVEIDRAAQIAVNPNTEAPGLRLAADGGYELCLPAPPTDLSSEQLMADGQEQAPFLTFSSLACLS